MVDGRYFSPVGTQLEIDLSSGNILLSSQLNLGVDVVAICPRGGAAEYRLDGEDPTSSTNFVMEEDKSYELYAAEEVDIIFKSASGVTLVVQPGRLR